eukprot:4499320-Pyramimonas_sp.AAC.1
MEKIGVRSKDTDARDPPQSPKRNRGSLGNQLFSTATTPKSLSVAIVTGALRVNSSSQSRDFLIRGSRAPPF